MVDIDSDATFVQHTTEKPSKNYVQFYRHFVEKFGEHRDYILIVSPGQQKTEVRREVKEIDKSNYPAEWTAFTMGKENQISGTPLEMMGLDKGLCDALKVLYVFTVEQAAELSDLAIQKIMGGHDIRTKAKAYLQKNSAEVIELKAKLEEANAKSAATENALQQQIADLRAQLEAFMNQPQRKKPGPKPKGVNGVASHDHTDRL